MKPGFTLIEMVIVVVILMILTGGIFVSFNTYNEQQKVKQAVLTLKSDLRLAQTKAVGGLKPSACSGEFGGYGINFTESSYLIAPYCSDIIIAEQQTYTFPTGVVFSPVPVTFRFYPLTRGTSLPSDLTMTLTWVGGAYPQTLKVDATTGVISD
jgi:prepilin-type N-terminal cleavage/methylation domain-containing protein